MNRIRKTLLWMLLLPMVQVMAITDQQVVQTAMNLHTQGMTEQDIAKQLLRDGATLDQLQRVSKQVNMMQQVQQMQQATGVQTTTGTQTTQRQNNGEQTPAANDQAMMIVQQMFGEPMDAQQDNKPKVFGQDIFRTPDAQFQPNMNQATPKNYTLGAGDEVIIDIYGAGQLNVRSTISPDGTVTIEGYGPIKLGGLTIIEATRRLKNTIGKRYQGSQIMLSLGQTRTITVNVMGEVTLPGSYQLSAFANVMNALYMAGGITEKGTLRSIRIFRQNQLLSQVDLYSYLMDGVLDGDVRLEDGDVVIVNTYNAMTCIDGKVKRPMYYEVKQDETLDRLLYFAGGFSGEAYTDAVRVMRKNNGAQSVHTIRNADFASFRLMDGDSIDVAAILPRLKNTVEIQGAVFRPGYYGLDENVTTIRSLVAAADGLSEDASATRAVLYRMQLDRTYLALAIDLQGILDGTTDDVELRNEDQLFVPSRKNELENLIVVIHGEVYQPDTFAYAHNESVEDLILRAGGLTEKASLSKVDIARRVIDPKAKEEMQIKTQLFTVELNDSLGLHEHGFLLEPYDEVFVRRSPAFGQQMNVRVQGEVLFEGTYTMKTQDDRLSDLVLQAGGLSSHAFTAGARLQRVMTDEEKLRRDQLLKMNRAASTKDSVNMEKLDLGDTYWVGIDLAEALTNPGSDEDITLREGDVLIVPTVNNTVKINGEVLYPNTVSFIKGKNARFYINQAGGFSNQARRTKAYIIYANGKVHPTFGGKVQPGCEIVVPSKPERQNNNAAQWVSIASASASLASVAATLATLIINSTKKTDTK
ncbi:MAG: SLBB domain-containing protein [Paludibacteraceae bacterium]|nr:SLBB domain-containing protein [Paludibacteraceae bacterium]